MHDLKQRVDYKEDQSLGSMVHGASPAAEWMQLVFLGDKLLRGLVFLGTDGCVRLMPTIVPSVRSRVDNGRANTRQ